MLAEQERLHEISRACSLEDISEFGEAIWRVVEHAEDRFAIVHAEGIDLGFALETRRELRRELTESSARQESREHLHVTIGYRNPRDVHRAERSGRCDARGTPSGERRAGATECLHEIEERLDHQVEPVHRYHIDHEKNHEPQSDEHACAALIVVSASFRRSDRDEGRQLRLVGNHDRASLLGIPTSAERAEESGAVVRPVDHEKGGHGRGTLSQFILQRQVVRA